MPSVTELLQKAESKGIKAKNISKNILNENFESSEMKQIMDNYVIKTPESALLEAKQNLNGFIHYWSGEEWVGKRKFDTPEQYMENVNKLFSSYSTLRRELDSSVAFIIGEWLLECKSKFFPDSECNRKEATRWSEFLVSNLCNGFKRTMAYNCMRVSRELKDIRGKSLSWRQMLAILKIKNKGIDLSKVDVEGLSELEIISLAKPNEEPESLDFISRANVSLVATRKRLEKLNDEEKNKFKMQISILKREVKLMLSIIDKGFIEP